MRWKPAGSHALRLLTLTAVLGLVPLASACGSAAEGDGGNEGGSDRGSPAALPAFPSLAETFAAVDGVADCSPGAPEPPTVMIPPGDTPGEAQMCTNTVIVMWFDDGEPMDQVVQGAVSSAAGGASVYLVEGANWFAADISEVAVGTVPERKLDLEDLADQLGATYRVAR